MNEKMIQSLINFKKAFNEVNKQWSTCNQMDELKYAKYPFKESFDELNIKVINWVDDSVKELRQ